MLRTIVITLVLSALIAALVGAGAVWFGVYNVAATEQHTLPVYHLLQLAMRRSVKARADDLAPPPLDDPAVIARGLRHYHAHCVQCHGAPGVARADEGKGMTPVPVNLAQTGREWSAPEIYWTVKHGIKMTGMPAWKYRMSEDDLWATTAFVKTLPTLTPGAYRAMIEALPTGSEPGPDGARQ